MIFAGLDVGTSGAKITVFNQGDTLFKVHKKYPSIRNDVKHVIDATEVLQTVYSLIDEVVERSPELEAIGVTSFGECFVLLDGSDRVLFESMLYTDPRGEEEALEINQRIGEELLGKITGQKAHSMFSLPKLLYIKKHHPDIYHRAKRLCLMEDFIVYSLTGNACIDYSLAARTLCFDITNNTWSDLILNQFDLDKKMFSSPVRIGHHAGSIKAIFNNRWKTKKPISIINVAHDQVASVIGAIDQQEEGVAVAGMGTCECITPIFDRLKKDPIFYEGGYGMIPLYEENLYGTYSLINTGSALIDWVIDSLFKDIKEEKNVHVIIQKHLDYIPKRIMVLPHFAGAATPYMDGEAKGAIVNLDLASTRYDIYQATLESLSYEAKHSLAKLSKTGIKIRKLYATGGGSLNEAWLQIKANVLERPIYVLENNDSGTVGTALVVGWSMGCFASIADGRKKLVHIKNIIYPDGKYKDMYRSQYQRFIKLYKLMEKVR